MQVMFQMVFVSRYLDIFTCLISNANSDPTFFRGRLLTVYYIYIFGYIYMGPWVHSGLYAQATPGPLFALLQGLNKRHVDRLTPLT